MQHSPKEWISARQLMPPAAYNAQDAAAVDTPVDTLGFRYALIVADCGAMAVDWDIQVTASATSGGTYAAVTGALFELTTADDDGLRTGVIDLQGSVANLARWLGVSGTGAAGVDNVGISVILFNPADSEEYIDRASGGVDELAFDV